ncbi:MAG: lamin tail domain-containing protein [Anaerolineae bacterium]|nr:MAG: lamin tail domain-containing protein [Anaerolineae bacterium]
MLITEVEYDTIEPNDDSRWEWLELHNTSDSLLTLDGWALVDNLAADPLPTLVITPGGYLVVAAHRRLCQPLSQCAGAGGAGGRW